MERMNSSLRQQLTSKSDLLGISLGAPKFEAVLFSNALSRIPVRLEDEPARLHSLPKPDIHRPERGGFEGWFREVR